MIKQKILIDDAIVIVEPTESLTEDDFIGLAKSVDAYLESHDSLKGLLIQASEFPGWEDFGGFIGHMKFVKNHHRQINKVALASDSRIASIAPRLTRHFVSAEVKSFDYEECDDALDWLRVE